MRPGIKIVSPFPDDIIASGPWVTEPGYMNRRIVLRIVRGDYVVHNQCKPSGGELSFDHGSYFQMSNDSNNALSEAFACFVHRCGELLGTDPWHVARRLDHETIKRLARATLEVSDLEEGSTDRDD